MEIRGHMNKVGKCLLLALFILSLSSVSFASSNLNAALGTLCSTGQAVLGGITMLLIVLSGVTYAVGQVLGAETRARATVWATAMITGAVIGALIYIVMPPVIVAMTGMPASCSGIPSMSCGSCKGYCYGIYGTTDYSAITDCLTQCSSTCAET
jgi:hypothetical protein